MTKRCVFCGGPPQSKTKEHVLPRWLIEATGDPNRNVYLGLRKDFSRAPEPRIYAFDQFTFPACGKCNNTHSILEATAKTVLEAILSHQEVTPDSLSAFLDWLDKVRVGIWLGLHQLDKNYARISPQFAIANRIGQYDRLLAIEKSDNPRNKLNFGGTDTLSFAFTPSAFLLIVNNYYFTNVSSIFLVARRLGFPYVLESYVLPDTERLEVSLHPGRERITTPIIRRAMREQGTILYQPMFPGGLTLASPEYKKYYNTDYVRHHSLNHHKGIGNLFIQHGLNVREIAPTTRFRVEPHAIHDEATHFIQSAIHVLEWQNWLHEVLPSLDRLSQEQRRYIKKRFRLAKRMNDTLIQSHRRMLCGTTG